MPEEKERPRPHGDPLKGEVGNPRNDPEDNQAQVQSDAPPDVVGGSDANGITAFDDADGERRRKRYDDGAELVSRID